SPLRFDYADILDPNFVEPDGENSLDTDGEGDDDPAEAAASESDDTSSDTSELCKTDCLQRELSRVTELLSNEELERLHMNIQESSEVYNDDQLDEMKRTGWEVLPDNIVAEVTNESAVDKLYDGYCGPSRDIMAAAKSPLKLFYYFMPKTFWRKVAAQTNLYWRQTLEARLQKAEEKERLVTNRTQRSSAQLRRKLEKFQKISPHEVVQWVGLMLAHALSPRKQMDQHWNTREVGVLPVGTFGRVMARDRFREISRFIHFTDNTNQAAATDRAWKIRSVLATLEKTFKEGYVLGSRVAIDEGVLP
ncbi:hypothetical protein PR003_g33230, partial [Phytophthora rubi]